MKPVAFNRNISYWYDVEVFEAHLEASARLHGELSPQAIHHLEAAVGLYKGDFLEGVAGADRHQAADRVGAAPPAHQHGDEEHQQEAGDDHHRDLVGEQGDLVLRGENAEIRRPLHQRMLQDVFQRVLGSCHATLRFLSGRRSVPPA